MTSRSSRDFHVDTLQPSSNTLQMDIELDAPTHISSTSFANERRGEEFSLPPTDEGMGAWLTLACCFCVECCVWGVPFTYGVFQEYYSSSPEFSRDQASVAIIGSVALGIMYLGSPITLLALRQWPQHRRNSVALGLTVTVTGLVMASFATRVWHLILTQGVLYGIGGIMMYYPVLLFIDEWWIRRKGFAFGVAWAGTGFSGIALPFFVSWSLKHYSFRTTLRILAVAYSAVMAPLLLGLKPRVPVSAASGWSVPSIRFALKAPFLPLQVGSILESLGYFLPGLFLPSYARHLGYSSAIATTTVILLNGGTFFGSLLTGSLVDRWHVTSVIMLSTVGATLSVLLLWGLSDSATMLCVFAFLYGLFGGGFSSTWPGVVRETTRQNQRAESGFAYALLAAGRGVGSVASGPLSDALLRAIPLSNAISYGYGTQYGLLILFAGLSNAMGAAGFVAYRLGWL